MDDIISQLQRSLVINIVNNTPYDLYTNVDVSSLQSSEHVGVFTRSYIAKGSVIGEITGDPMYVWDVPHNDFIIVGEEFVLDMSKQVPRTILSYLREDNQSPYRSNCIISQQVCYRTGDTRFFLVAMSEIHPLEELVYTVTDFMYS